MSIKWSKGSLFLLTAPSGLILQNCILNIARWLFENNGMVQIIKDIFWSKIFLKCSLLNLINISCLNRKIKRPWGCTFFGNCPYLNKKKTLLTVWCSYLGNICWLNIAKIFLEFCFFIKNYMFHDFKSSRHFQNSARYI